MKKLVLLAAVICSVSLFSCGNKAEKAADATEEVATEVTAAAEETPCCAQGECTGDSCKNDSANCAACAAEVVEETAVAAE